MNTISTQISGAAGGADDMAVAEKPGTTPMRGVERGTGYMIKDGVSWALHRLQALPILGQGITYLLDTPTRITGFLFALGDLSIGKASRHMHDGLGNDTSILKLATSGLGLLNSFTFIAQKERELDKPEVQQAIVSRVLSEIDAVKDAQSGEYAFETLNRLDRQLTSKSAGELWEWYRVNGTQIGSGFLAAAMALNMPNGMQRGNPVEVFNGLVNQPAYWLPTVVRGKDIEMPEVDWKSPRSVAGYATEATKHKPGIIGHIFGYFGTGSGLLAGVYDIWANKGSVKAGIWQVIAYGWYFAGDYFYGKIEDQEFRKGLTTEDKARIAAGEDVDDIKQEKAHANFLKREAIREDIYARVAAELVEKQVLPHSEETRDASDAALKEVGKMLAIETMIPEDKSLMMLHKAVVAQRTAA